MASAPLRVPPGFEDIALGQVEHLEIRLLDKSLGVFPVFVRPDDVRLETPEAVAQAIEAQVGLRDAEVSFARLSEALGRPMARNGHLACEDGGGAAGCHYLETASAEAIFDEHNGVLRLFLTEAWLPTQSAVGPKYRANTPGSESALIHSQIVNAATSQRYRNLTVAGSGALGVASSSYVGFTWGLVHASRSGRGGSEDTAAGTEGTRAFVDSLYYRHDLGPAHYVQGGRMDQRNLSSEQGGSFGFTMLPVDRFDGARIGTSQAYVNEASAAQGSPLTVLLTRAARVDAYRGSELLASAYFEAGVQQFDTRYFPEGTYLVTLQIFENDTLVRTETEPFTKVGDGAFGESTQWFVQAGQRVRDRYRFTQTSGGATAQSGFRTSLGMGAVLTSGLVWLPSRVYNETQLGWQHQFALGRLTTTAAMLFGTDAARGNTQSISFSNGVGVSLYRYQMRDASCRVGAPAVLTGGLRVGCFDSLNLAISAPLGKWQASAGYGQSRQYASGAPDADAFRPEFPVQSTGDRQGVSRSLQATLSRTFRWNKLSISARTGIYQRSTGGDDFRDTGVFANVSLSAHRPAAAGSQLSTYSSAGAGVRTNLQGNRGDRRVQSDYQAAHTWSWDDTSRREVSLNLSGSDARTGSAVVRGTADGRYGDASAILSHGFGASGSGGGGVASFAGSYASSLAVTRERVLLGPALHAGDPPAGVALAIQSGEDATYAKDSGPGGAAATLQVGGRSVTVDFGASAMLPLSGYRAQTGEIAEAVHGVSDHSVSLARGAGQHELFLTPGRLKTYRFTAGRRYTYIGRALGPDGLSLDRARVLSVAAPPLDDRGAFMIESPRQLSDLYLLDRGQVMRCEIRVVGRQDVIHLTGTSTCAVVPAQSLPESLQAQTRVRRLLSEVLPTHRPAGVVGMAESAEWARRAGRADSVDRVDRIELAGEPSRAP